MTTMQMLLYIFTFNTVTINVKYHSTKISSPYLLLLIILSYIINHFTCSKLPTEQQNTLGHRPAIYSFQSVLCSIWTWSWKTKCIRHRLLGPVTAVVRLRRYIWFVKKRCKNAGVWPPPSFEDPGRDSRRLQQLENDALKNLKFKAEHFLYLTQLDQTCHLHAFFFFLLAMQSNGSQLFGFVT